MKKLLSININYILNFINIKKNLIKNIIKIAFIAKEAGANSITITFKKRYKYINKHFIFFIKKIIKININFEIKISDEILNYIIEIKPKYCCFISKKNKIKCGINVIKKINKISLLTNLLNNNKIKVSVFINPDLKQIDAAINAGCNSIELNTKMYSLSKNNLEIEKNLNKIKNAAYYANKKGLIVNVGCGLNYNNIKKIIKIKEINEINISYSIMNKSIIVGLYKAIKKIILLIN